MVAIYATLDLIRSRKNAYYYTQKDYNCSVQDTAAELLLFLFSSKRERPNTVVSTPTNNGMAQPTPWTVQLPSVSQGASRSRHHNGGHDGGLHGRRQRLQRIPGTEYKLAVKTLCTGGQVNTVVSTRHHPIFTS